MNAKDHLKVPAAEEKTLDALAARITRIERGLLWAAALCTICVGLMAAQHTGISHYLISGIQVRGQSLSSSDVFDIVDIAQTSHDQNELPVPRSPPAPPTVPTISKLRKRVEEADLPTRSHPTHNIAQDESLMETKRDSAVGSSRRHQ
jgi:hypothetical protein